MVGIIKKGEGLLLPDFWAELALGAQSFGQQIPEICYFPKWRSGRAAEGGGLENR
jgi:hypothetical protein